jgi:hypothetical protein
MNEPSTRYDVTVTVDRDGGDLPDPADFALAAAQAGSDRAASVVTAHTADQIISLVTVYSIDRPAAVAVALAVASEALKRPVVSTIRSRDRHSRLDAVVRRTGVPRCSSTRNC